MTEREKFEQVATYDERLLNLEKSILKHVDTIGKTDAEYCANSYWYGYDQSGGFPQGFKGELQKLVGRDAENEELRSSLAYDICYEYLYGLLPDCRHQGICAPHMKGAENMIEIIIDSQSGELRVSSEALCILTDEESTYLRELAADLKRRYQEDE